ncbi:MAG TPA: glutathione peroxidase [Bacteroidia bacterium]|jgi:glutathione peroxidase|nr:glutathione peroxidase [Bacteroidota bacterium]HQW21824.1 glutathione peroxidase [Bacteroidia bacterium]
MKTLLTLIILITTMATSIYEFKVKNIDGKIIDLSIYKGKKILIVNTASECGYTTQYEGLQNLYSKYNDKLVIIGFPANNFGEQEPGTNTEIKSFCSKNYGVTFPMSSKVSVAGEDIDPLFKWLTEQPNPDFTGPIKWNFEKILIDENGKVIHRYRSKTTPMSEDLISAIEK